MKKSASSLLAVTFRAVFRRRWTAILMIAVVLAGCFATILLHGLTQQQAQALADFVADSRIRCIVTDSQGMNQTSLGMKTSTAYMLLQDEQYTQHIRDLEMQSDVTLVLPEKHGAHGILSTSSDPGLSEVEGVTITFYPGYTEEVFRGKDRVCLLPEHLLETWPDGVVTIERVEGEPINLTIIGIIKGTTANIYYVPYGMSWSDTVSVSSPVQRCSFALRDNTRLDEAKETFYAELFQIPKLTNNFGGKPGLLILDETYLSTKAEMESNLQLLNILQPVLLVLVGCVGLLTGHLTTRSRIKEFAVMRCLGMKKGKIFRLAILEQLVLSLLGLALGLVLGIVVSGRDALVLQAVLNAVAVALIFLVGTGLSATKIAGINVMKLMKVED